MQGAYTFAFNHVKPQKGNIYVNIKQMYGMEWILWQASMSYDSVPAQNRAILIKNGSSMLLNIWTDFLSCLAWVYLMAFNSCIF